MRNLYLLLFLQLDEIYENKRARQVRGLDFEFRKRQGGLRGSSRATHATVLVIKIGTAELTMLVLVFFEKLFIRSYAF